MEAAECWIVEPPEPPEGFHYLVGYLLNAGVDLAFGADDTLPNDLPASYDGIRVVVVCEEDLPRLRRRLRRFRGLDPDSDAPIGPQMHGWMYIHEDDSTWLAVYTAKGRTTPKRIENPLIVAPDLTVDSPRLKQRILDRPDAEVHRQMMTGMRTTDRLEWSDISFGTLWAAIGAYEATGDDEHLAWATNFADRQLEISAASSSDQPAMLVSAIPFLRLSEITGDPKYRDAVLAGTADLPGRRQLQVGGPELLQVQAFVHPQTAAHLTDRAADGGTYSEQVGLYYPSVLAVAQASGWADEAADMIGACLEAHRQNCRDDVTGLYHHGILGTRLKHQGFLGHGMLWTCFGLTFLSEMWPREHRAYHQVRAMFQEACEAAARVQDPDTGGFHHILDIPQTPYARIYTPALAYAFMRGARLGVLPPEFAERGRRAWDAVKRHVFRGGNFGGDSGAAQGKRLEYYLMQPMTFDFDAVKTKPFWQLHAANEALRAGRDSG